jgi:hypothetical protein
MHTCANDRATECHPELVEGRHPVFLIFKYDGILDGDGFI